MGLNKYVGWGLTTLAMSLLNKGSNSSDESNDPDNLNVSSNQTKIGSPIPVVLGRCLVKAPIVSYFGDFSSKIYTETYAAHANFSAWPMVFALIAQYIASPATTKGEGGGPVTGGEGGYAKVTILGKDMAVGPMINSLFMWLLNWLINGRNLKTTVQKGFKYYLGYQFLVAWSGKNMRIRSIYMNEEKVWDGDESKNSHQTAPFIISVDKEDLFGGCDEEGGFVGDIRVYLGGDSQGTDSWMVQQMSKDSVQENLRGLTPAYRPFVSVVVPTAYVGKQATIPETWIELQDCPNTLGLGQIGEDANPAELLYEIHTNNDWGLAEPADLLNLDSLIMIGKTLLNEGVGLSVQINSITKAQTLSDKICEHINAVKFLDPVTGKLTFRLIRDDYDVDSCLHLDTGNCSKVDITRLDWSQTVSKISVSYTDRKNQYEESNVPAVDPANIEINSGTQTTKTYDYTYFATAENALWAAKRELHSQAYPLATVTIEGNRQLAGSRIGDVVVLNWAPYGVKNMILRVTNVDLGEFEDGTVKLDAMEDVFGLGKTEFDFSGSTEWKPAESYPAGVQAFRYLELPYEICQSEDSYVVAFAAKPDDKTQSWTVWRQVDGGSFGSTNSLSKWSAAGRLVYDLAEFAAVEDAVGFEIADLGGIDKLESSNIADIAVARKGSRLLVINDEIIAYSKLIQLPNGHWYIKGVLRGVFDTVPAKHGAESNVFFIRSGEYANVTTGGPVAMAGTSTKEQYNITTSTVDHNEDFDYTKVKELKTSRRPELPSVPGRIRISAHLQKDAVHLDSIAGSMSLAFVPRNNRQSFGCASQDDEIEYWTKQNFEAAVDYVAKITVGDKSKEYKVPSAPFLYSWEQRCLDFADLSEKTKIELYARKDDLLSYQPQVRSFTWKIPTLVDGAASELIGLNTLVNWGVSDRIIMPEGPLSRQGQVLYQDLPIILLGKSVNAGTLDAIQCNNGSYIVPDGRIMQVTGKETYQLYEMQPGYVFCSYYVPSGGSLYYEWDGTKLIERLVP